MIRYLFFLVLAVLFLTILFLPSYTNAIEGFQGSTWGELRWELPKDGQENLIAYGWIKQGIDWKKWGNFRLNSYGTLRYRWDTEGLDWNNTFGPGVGTAIDAYNPKGILGTLGIEYIWDRYYESSRMDQKVVLYLNWYGWWDLKKKD
jgi:hypothetical protein